MRYCGPRGIAWDEFLGWAKVSRDAAIVWQLREQQTCGSCGTHPDSWDRERGGHEFAFKAEPRACRGCETVAEGQKQISKEHLEAGARIVLVHNPEAT